MQTNPSAADLQCSAAAKADTSCCLAAFLSFGEMTSRVGADGASRVSDRALEWLFFRWNMKLLESEKRLKEFEGEKA